MKIWRKDYRMRNNAVMVNDEFQLKPKCSNDNIINQNSHFKVNIIDMEMLLLPSKNI